MDMQALLAFLKPEAEKIDTAMRDDLASVNDPQLAEVLNYALFNGGKRFRPLLCVLAARLCGLRDDSVYRLAIAYEYLHVATLLHDDVIDHAAQRRGRPTVNTVWNTISAILAGDYLHARSMYLVGEHGGKPCLDIICRVTAKMVEGEFLQARVARNFSRSEEDYFAVINHKTASFIAAVCETGAVFAGGSREERLALSTYGSHLGFAFQIIDDLLDYSGNPEKTGKAVGNDFSEGKMTLPLIHFLAATSADKHRETMELLRGDSEARDLAFPEIRGLIENHGGFAYALEKANIFIDTALAGLDLFQQADAGIRNALISLGRYVLVREK